VAVLLAVVVGVLITALLGILWQRGEGRLRRGSGERILPGEVALPDGVFGPRGTLLLFTSPLDTRREAARAALDEAAAVSDGVRIAEVDLLARGDLAGRYAVTRTPTTFVLDGDDRLRARIKGVPAVADLMRGLAGGAGAA
jgi:hypothetical protein